MTASLFGAVEHAALAGQLFDVEPTPRAASLETVATPGACPACAGAGRGCTCRRTGARALELLAEPNDVDHLVDELEPDELEHQDDEPAGALELETVEELEPTPEPLARARGSLRDEIAAAVRAEKVTPAALEEARARRAAAAPELDGPCSSCGREDFDKVGRVTERGPVCLDCAACDRSYCAAWARLDGAGTLCRAHELDEIDAADRDAAAEARALGGLFAELAPAPELEPETYSAARGAWLRGVRTRYEVTRNTAGPWVIVPCSGSKNAGACLAAEDRYTGPLHRLALAAARALTDPHRIRIQSARYGLLTLDEPTEPYDRRVDALARDDYRGLCSSTHCDGLEFLELDAGAPVVALVPSAYLEVLRWSPHLARRIVAPLEGCAGIGAMRGRLAQLRDNPTAYLAELAELGA